MGAELDPTLAALVAAAATLTGPGATPAQLEDTAIKLALMATADSAFARRLGRILGATRFVGELADADIEASSTRALLRLHSEPSPDRPDGVEYLRSPRTDSREGRRLYDVARKAVGHRVVVFKQMESMANNPARRVRTCVWLQDLGPAPVAANGNGSRP